MTGLPAYYLLRDAGCTLVQMRRLTVLYWLVALGELGGATDGADT